MGRALGFKLQILILILCVCFTMLGFVSLIESQEGSPAAGGRSTPGGGEGMTREGAPPGRGAGFPGGGGPPGGGPGGPPGGGSVGLKDLGNNAGIYIAGDLIKIDPPSLDEGTILIPEGGVTDTTISGVKVAYDNIGDWSNGKPGQSGIIIDRPVAVIAIGGDNGVYSVNGKKYNSVITLKALDGEKINALRSDGKTRNSPLADSETLPGVGLAFSAKKVMLNNIYIETDGHNRSALMTRDSVNTVITNTTLVSNSDGWIFPLFICIHRGARTALLTSSGDTWCYNTKIYSSNWGTYSLDGCNGIHMYVVNSYSENTNGGYGLFPLGMGNDYARAGNNNIYVYGSKMVSAQYGLIFCDAPNLLIDSMDNVSKEAMSEYNKDSKVIPEKDYMTKDGKSLFAGAISAAVITFDMNAKEHGTRFLGNFAARNSVFSTAEKDLVDEKGTKLKDQLNVLTSELTNEDTVMGGMAYFAMKYIHGSVFWIRGASVDINLKDVDLISSSGVLFHSTVDMTNWSFSKVADGAATKNININLTDMNVKGDVIHDDYQREMNVNLINSSLEGAANYADVTQWNEKITKHVNDNWGHADKLKTIFEQKNGSGSSRLNKDTVLKNLVLETSYKTIWGLDMTIDGKSSWTVTDTSRLASLTIAEGAKIMAPNGRSLTMTVGGANIAIRPGAYKNVLMTLDEKPQ